MFKKSVLVSAACSFLLFTGQAHSHYSHVRNGCQNVNYAELGKTVVALKFIYDTPAANGSTGHVSTAWFITPTLLATVSHVAHDMFERKAWREVEIGWGTTVREPLDMSFPFMMRFHSTHNRSHRRRWVTRGCCLTGDSSSHSRY